MVWVVLARHRGRGRPVVTALPRSMKGLAEVGVVVIACTTGPPSLPHITTFLALNAAPTRMRGRASPSNLGANEVYHKRRAHPFSDTQLLRSRRPGRRTESHRIGVVAGLLATQVPAEPVLLWTTGPCECDGEAARAWPVAPSERTSSVRSSCGRLEDWVDIPAGSRASCPHARPPTHLTSNELRGPVGIEPQSTIPFGRGPPCHSV